MVLYLKPQWSWAWWCTLAIPARGRLRQEEPHNFDLGLYYQDQTSWRSFSITKSKQTNLWPSSLKTTSDALRTKLTSLAHKQGFMLWIPIDSVVLNVSGPWLWPPHRLSLVSGWCCLPSIVVALRGQAWGLEAWSFTFWWGLFQLPCQRSHPGYTMEWKQLLVVTRRIYLLKTQLGVATLSLLGTSETLEDLQTFI